jgi:hypothetical protein
VIGAILTAALLAALAVSAYRLWRRLRRRRLLASLPGGSRATAIQMEGFSDIDDHLYARECPCGGLLASMGERSERAWGDEGERLLRVVRVECRRCEERFEVWFDVTRAYH